MMVDYFDIQNEFLEFSVNESDEYSEVITESPELQDFDHLKERHSISSKIEF